MVSSFKKMRATKGAYIYRQHDKSESAYLILEGRLAVEIDCSLSKILGSYEYFGHDSLTYDASQNESIRVVTDEATLYWMSRADFQLISNSIM